MSYYIGVDPTADARIIMPQPFFHSISRDNNLNAIRYYLALSILVAHFAGLSGIQIITLPRIFGNAGSFFAISGFLMFHSYEKATSNKQYFIRRARRILPSYFLVVLLAALALSLASTLPASEYFTSTGFWKYLGANLSFLNFLHPSLPGVFESSHNVTTAVNGSLWTMKCEVMLYLMVPLVYLWIEHSRFSAATVLWICLVLSGILFWGLKWVEISNDTSLEVYLKLVRSISIFMAGGLANIYLEYVLRYRWWIIIISLTLYAADTFDWLTGWMPAALFTHVYFYPIVAGIMALAAGFTGRWGHSLARHDTISYDIYLFHFPIIQLLLYYGFAQSLGVYQCLFLAILITIMSAYLSWRFVGSRFLKSRLTTSPATAA